MREIKFRVWNKRFNKMLYTDSGGIVDDEYYDLSWGLEIAEIDKKIIDSADNYEIMQYASLKDKKGKEIYEGDILKVWEIQDEKQELAEIVEVVWAYARWRLTNIDRNAWDIEGKNLQAEVIGNIYEDTELLKDPGTRT